jgi:hypothetical protein
MYSLCFCDGVKGLNFLPPRVLIAMNVKSSIIVEQIIIILFSISMCKKVVHVFTGKISVKSIAIAKPI